MRLVWDENAVDDYAYWRSHDDRTLKRIDLLLADIERNGNEGIGRPEALGPGFRGFWSRRITGEHRLVYRVDADAILIAQCRYRYGS